MTQGFEEISGSGRFSHEPEWRRVTVRWDPTRQALSVGDGRRSMLASTSVDDLVISGDGLGTYVMRRRRGAMKPIQFRPDDEAEFERVAPAMPMTAPIDTASPGRAAPADTRSQPSLGLTRWLAGLVFAAATAFGLAAVLYVAAGDEYADYLEEPLQQIEEVTIPAAADGFYGLGGIGLVVAGVIFLIWFYQAYRSVAARGATGTRWSQRWAVGGWFIPFANFAIPKLVMNEVDRISHPDNGPPPIGDAWVGKPRLTASDLWWTSWVLAGLATVVERLVADAGNFDSVVLWAAVGSGLYAAAGVLLGSVVLTIGGRLR